MLREQNLYKNKYFKYKNKYFLLKKSIEGGASNTTPSAEEIGALLIARATSINDNRSYDERRAEEKDERRAEEKDERRAEEVQSKNKQLKDNSKEDEIRSIDTLIDNAELEALATKKSFFDILAEKLLASLPKETTRSKRMMNRSKIIGERLRKKNVDVSGLRK